MLQCLVKSSFTACCVYVAGYCSVILRTFPDFPSLSRAPLCDTTHTSKPVFKAKRGKLCLSRQRTPLSGGWFGLGEAGPLYLPTKGRWNYVNKGKFETKAGRNETGNYGGVCRGRNAAPVDLKRFAWDNTVYRAKTGSLERCWMYTSKDQRSKCFENVN